MIPHRGWGTLERGRVLWGHIEDAGPPRDCDNIRALIFKYRGMAVELRRARYLASDQRPEHVAALDRAASACTGAADALEGAGAAVSAAWEAFQDAADVQHETDDERGESAEGRS